MRAIKPLFHDSMYTQLTNADASEPQEEVLPNGKYTPIDYKTGDWDVHALAN